MKARQLAISICCLASLVFAACDQGDDDSGDGNCPNVSGEWLLEQNTCNPSLVGTTMSLVQMGCDITAIDPWPNWYGSVEPDGDTTWETQSEESGGPRTCTGTFDGDDVSMTCDPPCDVTARRL